MLGTIPCSTSEHPRVCGENTPLSLPPLNNTGTSPRMRGKLQPRKIRPLHHRNIPAYAGKTDNHASEACHTLGTSPRMRGKQSLFRNHRRTKRNIPAYAGKTVMSLSTNASWSEHPRVCGENPNKTIGCKKATGTSPRMRGKLGGAAKCHDELRNIPAYAGKTLRAINSL